MLRLAQTASTQLRNHYDIEGYQNKVAQTSESDKAEGNDINTKGVRIIVKADKDFLDTCTDYGFVVAKYTGNKAQADLDFSNLTADNSNGQKVISCKDSVNSGLGLDKNYVTLAVNNMSAGNKVVVTKVDVLCSSTEVHTAASTTGKNDNVDQLYSTLADFSAFM